MMKIYISIIFLFIGVSGFAQQFVYQPINPAFGGETFNYQWMLSSATAQNGLTAPRDPDEELTYLESFSQNLNDQILSQISRSLLDSQVEDFGNFQEEGTFTFGTLNVEVFEGQEGLVINILDTSTGETTQVIVPN